MQSYTPVKEKTKVEPDRLFHVARSVAEAKGYVAIEEESKPYTFETREREVAVSSVPRLSYRYTFQVSAKDGTLAIKATCTQNSSMNREKYEDCGDERPKRVIDEQQALRDAILQRIKTK